MKVCAKEEETHLAFFLLHIFFAHAHHRLPFVQVSLDAGASSGDGGLGGGSGGLRVRHVCGGLAVWVEGACPVLFLSSKRLWIQAPPTERETETVQNERELVKGEGAKGGGGRR